MKKKRVKIPERFRGTTRKNYKFKAWMDLAIEKLEKHFVGLTRSYHYDTKSEEMYLVMQEDSFYD